MRTPNYKYVVCGKEHYQRPNQIKKTINGLCCSKECGKINRKKHMSGEKNHQFGLKGDKNSSFKDGTKISYYGYRLILSHDHPRKNCDGNVFEHILVMEKYLGRYLDFYGIRDKNNEVCHHINGDRLDNRIENLELMTLGEHSLFHLKLRKNPTKTCKNCGKFMKIESGASWVFVPDSHVSFEEEYFQCKKCTEKHGRIYPAQNVVAALCSGIFE